MTSERLGEMCKGDSADMCTGKKPMGVNNGLWFSGVQKGIWAYFKCRISRNNGQSSAMKNWVSLRLPKYSGHINNAHECTHVGKWS